MFKSFFAHQIELLPWPACSCDLSPIENVWSMLAQRLVRYTPHTAAPDQLWQYVEAAWAAVPQGLIQSLFDSVPKRVAVVIPTMVATLTTDIRIILTSQNDAIFYRLIFI
ncbi:transposable element Tcb1 transposase [Trichonephila clavipes]|nr:transposable element Tcb1 transposase [Trichonephila clavipes]